MKLKGKSKVGLLALSIVVGTMSLAAATTTITRINYKLVSLKTATTEALEMKYGYQQYKNTPTVLGSSAQSGIYLKVTAKRKGLLGIYSEKQTKKFNNPKLNVTDSSKFYTLEDGTYKYELYDYGMERIEGLFDIYNSNSESGGGDIIITT